MTIASPPPAATLDYFHTKCTFPTGHSQAMPEHGRDALPRCGDSLIRGIVCGLISLDEPFLKSHHSTKLDSSFPSTFFLSHIP